MEQKDALLFSEPTRWVLQNDTKQIFRTASILETQYRLYCGVRQHAIELLNREDRCWHFNAAMLILKSMV